MRRKRKKPKKTQVRPITQLDLIDGVRGEMPHPTIVFRIKKKYNRKFDLKKELDKY